MSSKKAALKKKQERAGKDIIISVVFLSIVVLGIVAAILFKAGVFEEKLTGDRRINFLTNEVVESEPKLIPDIEEAENILYPGYDRIVLKAGKKMQDVYLHNPEENTCYFRMRLILEDGTVIWTSDYLEPGNAFNRIELDKALPAGVYENASLKYNSYSLKDGRELNGSLIIITLEAVE